MGLRWVRLRWRFRWVGLRWRLYRPMEGLHRQDGWCFCRCGRLRRREVLRRRRECRRSGSCLRIFWLHPRSGRHNLFVSSRNRGRVGNHRKNIRRRGLGRRPPNFREEKSAVRGTCSFSPVFSGFSTISWAGFVGVRLAWKGWICKAKKG